jgi:hypothetical protein
MDDSKRARTAETPKQPRVALRSKSDAPYPDGGATSLRPARDGPLGRPGRGSREPEWLSLEHHLVGVGEPFVDRILAECVNCQVGSGCHVRAESGQYGQALMGRARGVDCGSSMFVGGRWCYSSRPVAIEASLFRKVPQEIPRTRRQSCPRVFG